MNHLAERLLEVTYAFQAMLVAEATELESAREKE